jgi:hypothetical protein
MNFDVIGGAGFMGILVLAILKIIPCGAHCRNRTGTVITDRRILSPLRLPVPPSGHSQGIDNNYMAIEQMSKQKFYFGAKTIIICRPIIDG